MGFLQEQALAQARLQFERVQEAAKGALRSFAPGFGAGKLLADAMARRTAKVTASAELHANVSCTSELYYIGKSLYQAVRCQTGSVMLQGCCTG